MKVAWLLAALLAAPALHAADADCGAALDAQHRRHVEGANLRLAWAPQPAPLRSGRHFALDIVVCPGQAVLTAVDADMPAHRHGMNYRPSLKALGNGRYRADGLLLHMPGRWRLSFVFGRDRLSHEVDVE